MTLNYVYLLRCSDGTIYCGWTTDLSSRLAAHNAGKGAKYTRSRLPVELVYSEEYADRHEALSREWHLKRMSHGEKIRLYETGMQEKDRNADHSAGGDRADDRGGECPCGCGDQ